MALVAVRMLRQFAAPRAGACAKWRRGAAACGAALLLAGCAFEFKNRTDALDYLGSANPPGSVYTGWRVFQDKCAGCHGEAATGTSGAPDLLPRVRTMGLHQFVDVVLLRYDWSLPALPAGSNARQSQVEDVVQRKQGLLTMPAWQGEPRVNAHIADLHAYLMARASGVQAPGRPAP